MTVGELKKFLDFFSDDAEVIVFDEYRSSIESLTSVTNNNGSVQLNILAEPAEDDYEEDPEECV